jgi:TPR repeat protein
MDDSPNYDTSRVLEHLQVTDGAGIPSEMMRELENACREEDPEAIQLLGHLHEHGLTVSHDVEMAFTLYNRAAELGSAACAYNVGVMLANPECYGELGVSTSGDARLREAIEWWEKATAGGDTYALVCLGEAYQYGAGTPTDYQMAVDCYRRASEAGNPEATFRLAHCYRDGISVSVDTEEATRLLRDASDGGQPDACYELGMLYLDESLPSDAHFDAHFKSALPLFEKAADLGLPMAQEWCGEIYAMGLHVERDLTKAIAWLDRAIEADRPRAMFVKAVLLAKGDGLVKDSLEAFHLCTQAAEADELDGQYMAGLMLIRGDGMTKDPEAGEAWLRRAANAGHVRASEMLSDPDLQ